jgi:hypothetical protein
MITIRSEEVTVNNAEENFILDTTQFHKIIYIR